MTPTKTLRHPLLHLNAPFLSGNIVLIFGIVPPTKKQVKSRSASKSDHLLFCNYSRSYDDLSILICLYYK